MTYSLATSRGKPVVLVFYPGDDTPVCTKQLNSYNDGLEQFDDARCPGAGNLGPGRRQPRRRSPASTGSTFPLLADTDKAVAALYGTLGPIGFPRRSVFIIDADGDRSATPTARSPG